MELKEEALSCLTYGGESTRECQGAGPYTGGEPGKEALPCSKFNRQGYMHRGQVAPGYTETPRPTSTSIHPCFIHPIHCSCVHHGPGSSPEVHEWPRLGWASYFLRVGGKPERWSRGSMHKQHPEFRVPIFLVHPQVQPLHLPKFQSQSTMDS